MAELKPCAKCGGKGDVYKEWFETAFGNRPFIGYKCTKCHARTTLYMTDIDGKNDKEYLDETAKLWNKGCITVI